jgi:Flp pilus assembly protein CpaB
MSMNTPPFAPGPMAAPGSAPGAPSKSADKAPTKRRTRTYLAIFVTLAVAAAAIVLVGTSPSDSGLYVLRAKQSIPALSKLNIDQFEAKSVPSDLVEEGAITGKNADEVLNAVDLTNATAQYPINRNSQLTTLALSGTTLDKALAPDERLVSVRASVSRAVAGNLRTGDRVDVVVVGDQSTPVSNTLLQDVEIVAVALSEDQISSLAQQQVTAAQEGRSADIVVPDPIPGLYTLRVKANAVGALTVADQLASIYLVYRTDPQGSGPTEPITLRQALCTPAGGASAPLPAECDGIE